MFRAFCTSETYTKLSARSKFVKSVSQCSRPIFCVVARAPAFEYLNPIILSTTNGIKRGVQFLLLPLVQYPACLLGFGISMIVIQRSPLSDPTVTYTSQWLTSLTCLILRILNELALWSLPGLFPTSESNAHVTGIGAGREILPLSVADRFFNRECFYRTIAFFIGQ